MTTRHGFFFGLALGLVFVVGCAAGITMIPPARAQTVQRWEYLRVEHGWDEGRWAAEAGQEGWELVQVVHHGGRMGNDLMHFERPL